MPSKPLRCATTIYLHETPSLTPEQHIADPTDSWACPDQRVSEIAPTNISRCISLATPKLTLPQDPKGFGSKAKCRIVGLSSTCISIDSGSRGKCHGLYYDEVIDATLLLNPAQRMTRRRLPIVPSGCLPAPFCASKFSCAEWQSSWPKGEHF